MGDISVIARRREDGSVQYGWSGNGGYFKNVGRTLELWYSDPVMVDYLFGLGQCANICEPLSERNEKINAFWKTNPTGEPHWESDTERAIFSKIAFVDYGYFFDTDNRWYYVIPEPLRIKIPLDMVFKNLSDDGFEFEFTRTVMRKVIDYILDEYPQKDPDFAAILGKYDMDELRKTLDSEYPIYILFDEYNEIYSYFDDWVVIVPDEDNKEVAGILVRKREEPREETIDWPGHPVFEKEEYINPAIVAYALSFVQGLLKVHFRYVSAETDDRIVPQWFESQFRDVNEDDEAEFALLKKNFIPLHDESAWFRKEYEEGRRRGREWYFNFVNYS